MPHFDRPPADPMTRGLISAARSSALTARRSLFGTAALGPRRRRSARARRPRRPPVGSPVPSCFPRTSPTPTRWCAGPTGRPTSTTTRRPRSTRPSSGSWPRPASVPSTPRTSRTTTRTSTRSRPSCRRAGHQPDIFTFTDWMANRMIRDQLVPAAGADPDAATHQPAAGAEGRQSFDPGRNLLADLADAASPASATTSPRSGQGAQEPRRPVGRRSQGQDRPAQRDARHPRPDHAEQGVDISGRSARTSSKAMAEVEKRMDEGYIRRIKGNSYMEDLKSGNAIAGIVWSGDLFILRAETENENWEFVIPESGGTLWSDNMMVPITSSTAATRGADELLLRPRRRSRGRGLRQLRLSGRRRPGGAGEDRPRARREPVHLPQRGFIADTTSKGSGRWTPEEDQEYSAMWAKVVGN
jgi:spermidine/putrescine transport system substrate-binding protein